VRVAEHLAAVEIMQLKHIIILQNKIDLIDEAKATNQHDAIQAFIQVPRILKCGESCDDSRPPTGALQDDLAGHNYLLHAGSSEPDPTTRLVSCKRGSEARRNPLLAQQGPGLHRRETPVSPLVQGTIAEGAPVVPISAQLKYNIDAVCEYIVKKIPVPVRCAFASDSLALTACTCGIAPQPSPAGPKP